MRTSEQIKAEIEQQFGFFPNFFQPGLDNPEALDTLWQETRTAYLENPLPSVFKEKLFARLSRYCGAPFCLVIHSCLMRSLGQRVEEISMVLETPAPTSKEDIEPQLQLLAAETAPFRYWPEPNSPLEWALLRCIEVTFLNNPGAGKCHAELRRLLGLAWHTHLIRFLSYIRMAHLWIEAYPEISYKADEQTMKILGSLIRDRPHLSYFFKHYTEIVVRERESREERLSTELAELKLTQDALRVSEER